jgi:ATP-dependent protease ClpP protease subunit
VNQAHIYITPNAANPLGVIGECPGENGEIIKGTSLVDVMTQVAKYPGALSFLVHCAGPGGDVEAGNQIYNYLEGLKAEGKQVDTTTEGDIGSILTKIYMAGQNRSIVDGHRFFVHAPWVTHLEGNATEVSQGLQSLIKDEEKLREFYKLKTGITDAGLKGLMDGSVSQDGTFMTADQAVALKFATKKAPSKIKAFAQLKTNMANTTESVGQKFGKLLDMMLGSTPAPAAAAAKALVPLVMEGGMKLVSSAEDPNNLVGSTITDEAGQPVQDGEMKLTDGRILVIAQGKVTEVKTPAAASATPPATPSATEIALQAKVAALEAELNTVKSGSQAAIDTAINDLKNSLVSGKTPAKAINSTGTEGDQPQGRTIGQVMAAKREERKKQLIKN